MLHNHKVPMFRPKSSRNYNDKPLEPRDSSFKHNLASFRGQKDMDWDGFQDEFRGKSCLTHGLWSDGSRRVFGPIEIPGYPDEAMILIR